MRSCLANVLRLTKRQHTHYRSQSSDIEKQNLCSPDPKPQFDGSRARRATHLDGLRGLAALLVVLSHTTPDYTLGVHEHGFGESGVYWHITSLPFIRLLWSGGNAAVPIFFVLSAYALCIGPLRKLRGGRAAEVRRGLVGALIRRPIRLYGPAFAVLVLQVVLLHIPGLIVIDPELPPRPQENFIDELDFLDSKLAYFNPLRDTEREDPFWYNGAMWTLPIELRGSLMVYGLLSVLSVCGLVMTGTGTSATVARSILVLCCFSAALALHLAGAWSMACFVWGMTLAISEIWWIGKGFHRLVQQTVHYLGKIRQSAAIPSPEADVTTKRRTTTDIHWMKSSVLPSICLLLGWYLLSAPGYPKHSWYLSSTPGWRCMAAVIPAAYDELTMHRYWPNIGAVLTVYAVLQLDWLQKLLNCKVMQFLGRISYALYLTHIPWKHIFGDRVKSFLGGYVAPQLVGNFWDHTYEISNAGPPGLSPRFLLGMATFLPSAIFVAWLATIVIDEPCVRLGKYITYKLGIDGPKSSTLVVTSDDAGETTLRGNVVIVMLSPHALNSLTQAGTGHNM